MFATAASTSLSLNGSPSRGGALRPGSFNRDNVLYRVLITGANPFQFQVRGNPSIEHRGGTTVSHLVITKEEAEKVKALAFLNGAKAVVEPVEGENEEERATRLGRLNLKPEKAMLDPMCPMCPWFDPYQKGSACGRKSWAPEGVSVLLETSDHHRKASSECPVYPGSEDVPT